MQIPAYFLILVIAVSGIYFLWDLGLKPLALDFMRDRLFRLRFELFEMGLAGELSFDSDAYRVMETLLNALLRFAHRVTFPTYIYSVWGQNIAMQEKDYVDVAKHIELKISMVQPYAQVKLQRILHDVNTVVTVYMALTSVLFLSIASVLFVLRLFHIISVPNSREVSAVFEREAYKDEMRTGGLATA